MIGVCNKVFEDKDYLEDAETLQKMVSVKKDLDADGIAAISFGGVRPWECTHVVQCTNPKKGNVVLDIGSHKGILPFYLSRIGCEVHAIDVKMPDTNFLKYAKGREITYTKASIFEIPYPNEFFDIVYSICVLEHLVENCTTESQFVPIITRAIREVMRVLKSGDIFANTVDFYIKNFNTFRTFHKNLLQEIVENVKDVAVPLGALNYDIANPWTYYLQNSSVYEHNDPRRKYHIEELTKQKLPDNLFTCAALILRKL